MRRKLRIRHTQITIWSSRLPTQKDSTFITFWLSIWLLAHNRTHDYETSTCCSDEIDFYLKTNKRMSEVRAHSYIEVSVWWCSRFRSTILANIFASRGALAAAAAARRTRGAAVFCKRDTWWSACLPPGMVNYRKVAELKISTSKVWTCSIYPESL